MVVTRSISGSRCGRVMVTFTVGRLELPFFLEKLSSNSSYSFYVVHSTYFLFIVSNIAFL
jgi:hypothetical protein